MTQKVTSININRGQTDMPSANGYVSLWRDLRKQPFYNDFIARGMFIDMLIEAQHRPRQIEVNGQVVFLTSGQLFVKRCHFVGQGIDDSKVRRVMDKFERLEIISREVIKLGKRNIGTRITFKNWSKWQKTDQSTDQSTDQLKDQPDTAEIKALSGGCDQSSDQSTDQSTDHINNNVYNKDLLPKGNCGLQGKQPDAMPKGFYESIKDLYNSTLTTLPACKVLSPTRKQAIKARTKNEFGGDFSKWRTYFEYVRDHCQWMLSGKYSINFDYLIKQKNVIQIMEGAKDDC